MTLWGHLRILSTRISHLENGNQGEKVHTQKDVSETVRYEKQRGNIIQVLLW